MKVYFKQFIKKAQPIILVAILLSPVMPTSHANTQQHQETAKNIIIRLYRELPKTPTQNMANRLERISNYFLGKPYLLGALGEGETARYDQSPRYRDDGFDCETLVDTVLAIAFSSDFKTFEYCIDHIRYQNGQVDFITRNHFTDLDWNTNNQKRGYLVDITESITNPEQEPVALMAKAIINKPAWYQHLTADSIKIHSAQGNEQAKRLIELKHRGSQLSITPASIPYIPLSILFDKQGKPNLAIFSQIPHGAIIEIIRPNWDLRQQIGTCLNVSHLGFVFWIKGEPIFRQASSEYHQVVDMPLIDYLKKARTSPTIKGINIQIVKPKTPACS